MSTRFRTLSGTLLDSIARSYEPSEDAPEPEVPAPPTEDEFSATLPEAPAEVLAANAFNAALAEEKPDDLEELLILPGTGSAIPKSQLPADEGRAERDALSYIDRAKKTAMRQNPNIPESAFNQAWTSAYSRIKSGAYTTAKDILDNYKADSRLDLDAFDALNAEAKTARPKFIAVSFDPVSGKAVPVPITGTSFDKRLADRLPEGPEKTLLLANLDQDDWQDVTADLLDTEENRSKLEKNPTARDIRNLYRPGPDVEKTGLPLVIVPMFEDPTLGRGYRGRNSIDIDVVRDTAGKIAFTKITGGRSMEEVKEDAIQAYYGNNRLLDVPLEGFTTAEAYADAVMKYVRSEQKRAGQQEVNHLRAQLKDTYLFGTGSESIEDYLEGDIYGGIGTVPVARELGALTLPVRAVAGTITGPDDFKKGLAEEGGIEFLAESLKGEQITEYGMTRALDDLIRVAPSTVLAAAEWQAYKEWLIYNKMQGTVDADGKPLYDPREGRQEFVRQRAYEISNDPDRLTAAIASNYDPAGQMLTKAGKIEYPGLYEDFPTLATLLAGAPRLAMLLVEPDALQASLASAGGVLGLAGAAGGKGISAVGKLARSYKTISRGAARLDDAIQAAESPAAVEELIRAAVKNDVSGSTTVANKLVAQEAARQLNAKGSKDAAKLVASEMEALKTAETSLATAAANLDKRIDAAKGAKTAAEQKVESTKVVQASLEKKAAEVDKLSAELDVRRTQIDLAVREAAVNKQMEQLSTPTAKGAKKADGAPRTKKEKADRFEDLEARNRELVSLQKSLDDIEAGDLSPAQKRQASADVRERIKTILVKTSEEADARATSPKIQQMLADQSDTVEKLRKVVGEAGWKADRAALGRIVSAAADGGKGYDELADLALEQVSKAEKAYAAATDKVAEIEKQLEITNRAHEKLAVTPSTDAIPGLWNNQENSLEVLKRVSRTFRAAAEVAASKEGQKFINARFRTPEGTTTRKIMTEAPEEVASITDKYFEVQNRLAAGDSKLKVVAETGGEGSKRLVLSLLGYAAMGQEAVRGFENINNTAKRLKDKHGILWTKFARPSFYTDRFYTLQAKFLQVADAIDRSGIATTRVGVLGNKFAEVYQEAANANSREIRKWFNDTDVILTHFSGEVAEVEGKVTSIAKAKAVEYIGTQNRIELGGTRANIDVTGNQLGGGPTNNILNLAIDNWASVGETFIRTEGVDLTEHFLEKSDSLQGFVVAHVADNTGGDSGAKIKQAIVGFGRWLNRVPDGQSVSNAERIKAIVDPSKRMSELSKGVMSEIAAINRRTTQEEALILTVVGKNTDPFLIPGQSFKLAFKTIIQGAMERNLVQDFSNLTSGNLGIRNIRAVEFMIRGAEEGSNYKGSMPLRETIEIGDRVAMRSEIDPLRSILFRGDPDDPFRSDFAKRRGPKALTSPLESELVAPVTYEVGNVSKTGVVTLIDTTGGTKKVQLEEITRMGGEFANYDLVDGYLAYGLSLARNIGIADPTSMDFLAKKWNGLRDNYVRFILHSYDENGNPNIIPKLEWANFSYDTRDLIKNLDVTIGAGKSGNELIDTSTQVIPRLMNWWKNKTLFGATGIKAARFFLGNADGDFEKIAVELGYSKALQVNLIGNLGYVPVIGPMLQDGTRRMISNGAQMLEGIGAPAPSLYTESMNAFLDDVLEGVDETRTYYRSNGESFEINPREFKRDATRAGVFEDILRAEGSDALRAAADREYRANISDAMEVSSKGLTTVEKYHRWLAIMRDANAVGTHRTKFILFSDLVVNQGMSISEATKAMNRTIFDYTLSVSPVEAATIAKYSTFYTYSKNEMLTTAAATMGVDRKMRAWFLNNLVIGRRYKRARAYYRYQQLYDRATDADISDPEEGVGVDDTATVRGVFDKKIETREKIFREYDYLMDSMNVQKGALPTEIQDELRGKGSFATSYVLTSGAPMGILQTLNTFASIQKLTTAGIASMFFNDLGFNTFKAVKEGGDAFLDQFYPAQEAILEGMVGRLLDTATGFTTGEVTLNLREYETAEQFGLLDVLGIETNEQGQFVSRNPLARAGILDPANLIGDEGNFIRLLATTVMGDIGEPVPTDVRAQMKVYAPKFPLRIPELDPIINDLSGGKIQKFEFNKYEDLGPFGIRLVAADIMTREMKIHMFNSTKNISANLQSVKRLHEKRMKLLARESSDAEVKYEKEKAEEE